VAIESRSRWPVLELALLRRTSFAGVLAGALLYSIAAFAYLAYESLWLQSIRGMSPAQAGLALTPLALSALIVSLAAGRWLHAVDTRWRIAGGLALIGAGAVAQAHVGAASSWATLVPGLALTGIGVGLATGALAAAALATVPADRGGIASGALSTARQLGYALGIAALGLVCKGAVADRLTGTVGAHGSGAAARAVTGGQAHALLAGAPPRARANLDLAIHSAFAHGLDLTLLAAGGAGLAAAAIVAFALRQRHTVEPAVV
jgi:predicted MFS family arabinose efflux permease